ncbi:MAG TPA: BlaI/MecI/CopY family transcriptional regulator [Thermoguttaceae bacterium]|nr:BlaI/MecI/CopY family transcriptional regulator [Thermoguttaceae bacterium]
MAKKRTNSRPTDAELAILRVLWQRGPSTVREVRDVLDTEKPTGYTTALKFMQIMHDKGLLVRDESQRSHVYQPRVPAEKTQRQLVADLLERAFEGSARNLVMQALSAKKVSPEELAQIRALLDEIEGEEQ